MREGALWRFFTPGRCRPALDSISRKSLPDPGEQTLAASVALISAPTTAVSGPAADDGSSTTHHAYCQGCLSVCPGRNKTDGR